MQPPAVLPMLFEVLPRVARIAACIAMGALAASPAVTFDLVERIVDFSRYLTGSANFPDEVETAVVTTAASMTASYRVLAEFHESGVLGDRMMFVVTIISTFSDFIQHIFTFYWSVFIFILGHGVGFMYVGTRAVVAFAITATGVVADTALLADRNTTPIAVTGTDDPSGVMDAVDSAADAGDSGDVAESDNSLHEAIDDATRSIWKKLRRIIPQLVAVYMAATFLFRATSLESFVALTSPLTNLVDLPGAAVPVTVAFAFDATTGTATIASAIDETFTPRQVVTTILIGGTISFAALTFKRSIPFQYDIRGLKFGPKVIIVNTGLRIVFIAVTVALLVAWVVRSVPAAVSRASGRSGRPAASLRSATRCSR